MGFLFEGRDHEQRPHVSGHRGAPFRPATWRLAYTIFRPLSVMCGPGTSPACIMGGGGNDAEPDQAGDGTRHRAHAAARPGRAPSDARLLARRELPLRRPDL